jgi:exodeoxyribonuclease VII small subunit
VAIAPRNSGENTPKPADMPFEEALKRLESIVSTMEGEDLPLEKLLASYQEGSELAKVCQTKLAEAELRIQQLEKTGPGEFKLKPVSLDKPEAE